MKRVLFSDNSTISDFTYSLKDIYSDTQTISLVAAEDAIFVGSELPFNNFYIGMGGTVNAESSIMSVSIWDGSAFSAAVEVDDGTDTSGATLAKSGLVQFVPNRTKGWSKSDTSSITDLTGVTIYDRYWIKLTFSADLTASVVLNWVGSIFSNDNDLQAEFPDIVRSNVLAAFETGKTTWDEQHQVAAKIIIKDLIAGGEILTGDQIMTVEDLRLASVQKVAALIYNAMGDDYLDQFTAAEKEYRIRLNNSFIKADKNNDGIADLDEQKAYQGRLYR